MMKACWHTTTIVSILFTLVFSACNPHEYRIDPAFTDYLQRFKTEGASRGHNLTPETSGLIMEFGTLADGTAGLTHYETPVRIQIDKTYWNAISNTAGADMMKEDLIFHELGHALLGRPHINDVLPNGDWKSVMCGGTKVNNRPWNINYRGVRRKYYIDELFDITASTPVFSSMLLPVDTTGYKTDYFYDFSSSSKALWTDKSSATLAIALDNGRLAFKSTVNQIYLVFADLASPIAINTNFSYEVSFQYPGLTSTGQFGLIFGTVDTSSDGTSSPIEYFTINNSGKMQMGNRSWYSYYTELTESSIRPAEINKLKVVKVGTFLYYFINNTYCYMSEIEGTTAINKIGLYLPPLASIWIDNLKIAHSIATMAPAGVKQMNQQLNTHIESTDRFTHTNSFDK